jgi:hypothetical protein
MDIEPSTLRILWTVVEDMPSQDLLFMSDTALIAMLMKKVTRRNIMARKEFLSGEQVHALYGYIGTKLSLIRDMTRFRFFDESIYFTNVG